MTLAGRTGPAAAPAALLASARWWLVAIGAGVLETVLAVGAVLADHGDRSGLPGQVAVRVTAFAVATWLTLRLRAGDGRARAALAVLLSGLGLLSLLVGPLEWLLEGHRPGQVFDGLTLHGAVFGASRVLHVVAVVTATVLMYRPSANRYVREVASRRLRARARGVRPG